MEYTTLNSIINAFNTTIKDATRYHLMHVRIERTGESLIRITSTDGKVLSDVTVTDDNLAGHLKKNEPYLASPEVLPALKAIAKEYKRIGSIPARGINADDRHKGFEIYSESMRAEIKLGKELKLEFPDFDRLFPTYVEQPFQVTLNPELLLSLLKAMREHPRQEGVTLVIKDKLSVIRVRVGGNEGLLMPMRCDDKEYVSPQTAGGAA